MSQCPISEQQHRRVEQVSRYLRKPDTRFWSQLLSAAPPPTAAERQRRLRIARFALGAVTLISFLYAIPTLLIDAGNLGLVAAVTGATGVVFALGMWLAALDRGDVARAILMVTLTTQLGALMLLSGNELLIVVFTPVVAALARVLYTAEERIQRALFIVLGTGLFVTGMLLEPSPRLDFSGVAPWLLVMARIINTVLAVVSLLAIISTYDNDVLRNEAELVRERQRSDQLLHAVLPASIVSELRAGASSIARRHEAVTVLFADIAGFTPWSASQTPEHVVAVLEQIFSRFDRCVIAAGAEKIKTIGDAYMVIAGAPVENAEHASVIADLALAMHKEVEAIRAETGMKLDLRVGIHSGALIGGVIGVMRFSYDVWGDTVNTASRMESHGEPGRIQLTDATRALLPSSYQLQPRGNIEVKGKGLMQAWWLLSNGKMP